MSPAAAPPNALAGEGPDHYARTLEERLAVELPQPGPAGGGQGPHAPEQLRATKLTHKSTLALDNGDELQLFRERPWLGGGTCAKVVPGILRRPASATRPARAELVAVKKARLQAVRRRLAGGGRTDPGALRTCRTVAQEARQEMALGLRAQSSAAGHRLVITAKQAYMLMPPMPASLHQLARQLLWDPLGSEVHGSVWGTYILRDLLPKLRLAHAHQVVHHDLSLKNILLRRRSLHLADFGLARHTSTAPQEAFHGTPWCASPEALCASLAAPACPIANDFFALGMIVLVVAGGPLHGQALYQSLVQHTCQEAGWRARRAYLSGWEPFFRGSALPPCADICGHLFAALRGALLQVREPLRSCLRSLMSPSPQERRHSARLMDGVLRLTGADQQQIWAELDALDARAARSLAERLLAGQGGDAEAHALPVEDMSL